MRGSFAAAAARVAVAGAAVVTVPVLLGYLGVEGYGLWVTAATISMWVALGHVGLPMSLLNQLAAVERQRHAARRALVSTAWWSSVLMAIVGLAVLLVLTALGVWPALLNAPTSELGSAATLFALVMCLGAVIRWPLKVPMVVLRADQEVHRAATVQAVGTLLTLAAMVLVVSLDAGLGWLVVAATAAPIAVMGVAGVAVFRRRVGWPRLRLFDRRLARALLSAGVGFLVVAIAKLAITSTDVILVAQLLGPAAVTSYSVAFALLMLFMGIEEAVLDGIWPAYTEAAARSEGQWIRRTNRTATVALFAAAVVFAAGLVMFGPWVIEAWAGPEAVPPMSVLVVFGAIAIVQSVEMTHNRVLLATGRVRRVMVLGAVSAALNIPISIVLGNAFGLTGVALGTLLAVLAIVVVVVRAARAAMREVDGRGDHPSDGQPLSPVESLDP